MNKRKNAIIPRPSTTIQAADELSERQAQAVALALQGHNDSAIAERVGVTRQTVNYWRNQDPHFRWALAHERERLLESQRDKLGQLIEQALEILSKQLASGDPATRAALAKYVLSLSGLRGFARAQPANSLEDDLLQILSGAIGEVASELTSGGNKKNESGRLIGIKK